VVDRAEWLLEVCSAISSDLNQAISKIGARLALELLQSLSKGVSYGGGQRLAGQSGNFLRKAMRFFILDVQTHKRNTLPFYQASSKFYHPVHCFMGLLRPAQ
jgi:hypothetical protein